PHPSIARAQLCDGLADRRRQHLRPGPKIRRTDPASAFPRDRDPDFKEQGAGARGGAGAGAHAGTAESVRLERGVTTSLFPSPLVGEGGSLTRSDSETDEGFVSASVAR